MEEAGTLLTWIGEHRCSYNDIKANTFSLRRLAVNPNSKYLHRRALSQSAQVFFSDRTAEAPSVAFHDFRQHVSSVFTHDSCHWCLSGPWCEYKWRTNESAGANVILPQLEWARQLSNDGQNLVVAIVRNLESAKQPETLRRPNVAVVKGDLSDLDSFSVNLQCSNS